MNHRRRGFNRLPLCVRGIKRLGVQLRFQTLQTHGTVDRLFVAARGAVEKRKLMFQNVTSRGLAAPQTRGDIDGTSVDDLARGSGLSQLDDVVLVRARPLDGVLVDLA